MTNTTEIGDYSPTKQRRSHLNSKAVRIHRGTNKLRKFTTIHRMIESLVGSCQYPIVPNSVHVRN